MLAAASQGQGQLTAAVEHAQEAVRLCAELPKGSTLIIGALRALIGALAESGRLDEAWEYCQAMNDQMDDHSMSQLAGEVAWVIGNVAFMRHDYPEGIKYHERAGRLLSPANDIDLWARFNKASAAVRLSSGIVEPETLSSIERAELALSIVGGNKTDQLEVAFIRARWLYLTGDIVAAVQKLREIHAEREALARHTAGEVSLLLGKALKAAGESDEALVLPRGSPEGVQRGGRLGPGPAGAGRRARDQAGPAPGRRPLPRKPSARRRQRPARANGRLGERPAGELLVGLDVAAAGARDDVGRQRRAAACPRPCPSRTRPRSASRGRTACRRRAGPCPGSYVAASQNREESGVSTSSPRVMTPVAASKPNSTLVSARMMPRPRAISSALV